jgi:FMN phosphatase YigB (HAD superfamily)
MLKYAFIDWDKTLYDAPAFESDIFAIFDKNGVSKDDYNTTFRRSLCTVSPDKYDYNFEEHVEFLRELGYELSDNVTEELNRLTGNNYLYAGAYEFVQFIKTVAEKIILLSAGDREFQWKKFRGCGAEKWFDEVVVISGGKDKYICENFDAGKFLFVNDNLRESVAVKKCAPEAIVVVRYEPKRYTQAQVIETGLPYFQTLTEIKNYVSGLI